MNARARNKLTLDVHTGVCVCVYVRVVSTRPAAGATQATVNSTFYQISIARLSHSLPNIPMYHYLQI